MEESDYKEKHVDRYLNCKKTESNKKYSKHKIPKLTMTQELNNSINETIKELQKTHPNANKNHDLKKRKTLQYEPIIDPSKYNPEQKGEIVLAQGKVNRSVERLQKQLYAKNAAYVNEIPLIDDRKKAKSFLEGMEHFCKILTKNKHDKELYNSALMHAPKLLTLIRQEYRRNEKFPDLLPGNSDKAIVNNCENVKEYLKNILIKR